MRQAPLKILIALGATLALLVVLTLLLYLTDLALSVWGRLQEAPLWLGGLTACLLLLVSLGGGWVVLRILAPGRSSRGRPSGRKQVTEQQLHSGLQHAEALGADVAAAQRELDELGRRRDTGVVYVALLGTVSSGKSSLIAALLPEARPEIDPRGGTTREVTHYAWESPAGDRLVLSDLPGLNAAGAPGHAVVAREEALRAHVVIYVCEGDLTRDQLAEVQSLRALDKPTILALNKSDLHRPEELAQIRERIAQRIGPSPSLHLVAVSTGGLREVIRVLADGREQVEERHTAPRVDALRSTLQALIDGQTPALEQLRDVAVFNLVAHKLDTSVSEHRRRGAEQIVKRYSRRAVFGAMAAWTPGSDLVIQGYLGTQMIRELGALYDVPPRDIDAKRFLGLAAQHLGKTLNLVLAVTGNALKAFPGIGTLAGGGVHAVAYGLIFHSLGQAAARTLESRGQLLPEPAAVLFKETLGENLELRAKRLAQVALAAGREDVAGD